MKEKVRRKNFIKQNVEMINIFLVIYDRYYALLSFREKRHEKVNSKIIFYFVFLSD